MKHLRVKKLKFSIFSNFFQVMKITIKKRNFSYQLSAWFESTYFECAYSNVFTPAILKKLKPFQIAVNQILHPKLPKTIGDLCL
jgi:hypothetical protein